MKSSRGKKKKVKRLIVILLIFVAISFSVIICLLTIPRFRVLRKINKAEKYLTVFDYDLAIETYEQALSIDSKESKVFDGLRRAYLAKGDSVYDRDYSLAMECYDNALSFAKRGFTDTGDSSFSDRIQEIENLMLDKHQHDSGTYFDVKMPTCSEEGIRELRCNACGEVLDTVPIEKLPHTPGDWEEDSAADCVHEGLRVKRCTVCGEVAESEAISKLPHEPGEWETERESSCMPGLKVRKCVNCGEVVESEEIPAVKSHVKGTWEVIKEPDCVNPGEKILKCKQCGSEIDKEEIQANGHKREAKGEKFEDTDVLIYKCSECGIILEPESIARVTYMDSLPQTKDDGLFSSVDAKFDDKDKGKLTISFSLNEETVITDFGYLIMNQTDLSEGVVVTFNECRNKIRQTTSNPRNLIEKVGNCSITDSSREIETLLKPSTAYYYRVFYVCDGWIYLSDFYRFVTKAE